MTMIRSLIYVVWLYGSMAVIGIGLAPMMFGPRAWIATPARLWARAALWGLRVIVGATVTVKGLEKLPHGACLVAMKHQATLDIFSPFTFLNDPAFVLKQELMATPVLGWHAARLKMIPVVREAGAPALRRMMAAAREAVAAGRPIVIYPEGTRRAPGAPPDYKPGVAGMYRDLNIPCAPVALNSGLVWPARGLLRRPGRVTIEILDAIPPGLSRAAFLRELETRIETATTALLAGAQAACDAEKPQ